MLEGEQAPQGSLDVPSSPPKKFKFDSGRPEDPRLPSRFSDLQLPGQPSMSDDRGHVMMSQPELNALLGAESLVNRAPVSSQGSGPMDYLRRPHDSFGAAGAKVSHGEGGPQHTEPASWYSEPTGQWAEMIHPQGQSAARGPHPGQVPTPATSGGQSWNRLDGQSVTAHSGQQTFSTAGHRPGEMGPLHASHHAHQEGSCQPHAMVHGQSQHQFQMYPAALPAIESAAWPVRTPQIQQQQQQQQIRFPSVTDFNPADFHAFAASPSGGAWGMDRVVSGTQQVWDSASSAGSYSTESDGSDCEAQVMFEGHLEEPSLANAGNASCPDQDVPQMQMMSRENDDGDGSRSLWLMPSSDQARQRKS